jgi:hypothetical protein
VLSPCGQRPEEKVEGERVVHAEARGTLQWWRGVVAEPLAGWLLGRAAFFAC